MSFAERITKEEYERQSHDYTKQMLDDLSNMVRREPSLTKKAVHFGQTYARFRSRELLLRIGMLLLIGGPLWFAFSDCTANTMPDLLYELRTRVVCKMGIDMTSIPPFLLMLVGGGTFCLWILSMYLTSLQIQHKLSFIQQIAMVFISSLVLPFFIALTATLFLFFLATSLYHTTSTCMEATSALASWIFPGTVGGNDLTRDAVVTVLEGAGRLAQCATNSMGFDMKTCLFFALVACVYVVLSFARTLLGIGNLHNTMKLALWVLSAVAINVFNPTSTRKGEQLVMLAWASNVLVYFVELVKLLSNAVRQKKVMEREERAGVEGEGEEELEDGSDADDSDVTTTTTTTTMKKQQ